MASQTIVAKIGTSSLTQPDTGYLSLSTIAALVETLVQLQQQNNRVILVSSGAVGVGCARLGLIERPRSIALKQAIAAIGQGRLMRVYDDLFTSLQQPIAQVLLSRSDLVERSRYINVRNTFQELLRLGAIPIVNENDTVAVDELKFGDNDTLSALVASLMEANWLFLLTDVDRLYQTIPAAILMLSHLLVDGSEHLAQLQSQTAATALVGGTGGMVTKLAAAQIATAAGVRVAIAEGKNPSNIHAILQGGDVGTQFAPQPQPFNARKRWIAYGSIPAGKLFLDNGAIDAICQGGKSLLAAGIDRLEGEFESQAAVQLCDRNGREIARGLVNYNSRDLAKIQGRRSDEIPEILGYANAETVVHRDNLALLTYPLPASK